MEELYEYKQDLKDLIARLPEDEPEVIANFKEFMDFLTSRKWGILKEVDLLVVLVG